METEQQSTNEAIIRFLRGPLAERTITIQKPVITIGRDSKNDIVILDPGVSRDHACISWQNNSWMVKNLSQNNYVTINKQRTQEGILHHNSVVGLGKDISFIFIVPRPLSYTVSSAYKVPITSLTLPQMPDLFGEKKSLSPSSSNTLSIRPAESMIPSLIISSNIYSDQQLHFLNKSVVNIGRDASNDITITEPIISAFHIQITREGNNLFFTHPHPSRDKTLNGLWYQGQHIRGDQIFRKQLANGDIFRIGDEDGTLITLTYNDGSGNLPEALQMRPIPLHRDRLTLGRTADNTVVLNHPLVSGQHAILEKVAQGYRIIDTNSANHVYVNGQPVSSQLLHTGDELRIGPYRLTYTGTELREYDESAHICIEALHLNKVSNNHVTLLHDISLVIPPRTFVALVGASGSGKSTLLDALNGLRPAQKGIVYYNNVDYYRAYAAFNTQLGYVPQDDIVHRDLSVEHALYYAARLRLPRDFTTEQIHWRIDEVLADVEMSERRTLLVSKLSGGQRKRISIALELLANPGVFFLDEPTSGLDPGLDRKMMLLLRRLADRGHTIVLVTHATNNINVCDSICFLTQGGRLAYFGPPNAAKTYFEKVDFAEIYSTLESTKEQPDIPKLAEARFLASPDYQRSIVQPLKQSADVQHAKADSKKGAQKTLLRKIQQFQPGKYWLQFIWLSMRYLELLKNDVGSLLVLLLQAPIIAIILVLMVRFEVGTDIFVPNQLVQCATQVLTSSGPLVLPQAQQTTTIDCQKVLTFLYKDPQGLAFAQQMGGVQQALQFFILLGPGADAQKVLFIMSFATVLFGCINGAREIVKEAAIYKRERAVSLSILPYIFSKIVVQGLLCLFQSAALTFVIELGEPLHQGIFLSPVLETYITLALTSLAGLMIGLTISAIAPNNDRALSIVPIILIPQVIFSGAIIPLKDWFTQTLAVAFPTRWAMIALGTSIGLHADKIGGDHLFGNDDTYHGTLYSIYNQAAGMHRLLLSWTTLVVLIFLLIIVISVLLKRKDIKA